MSETQTQAPAPAANAPESSAESATSYVGRYIPYGGGCLGWYENSGVLKTEIPNNYTFYTAIDPELVRARQHAREGSRVEKRRATRKDFEPELSLSLVYGGEDKAAVCKDLSLQGMRVVCVGEDIAFKKGDKVTCRFPQKSGRILLELACTIVWAEKSGRIRTIWSFGASFPTLTTEQQAAIRQFGDLKE